MKKKQKIERRRAKARCDSRSRGRAVALGDDGRDAVNGSFKREQTIKTAKWNRYMFLRYLDAGLFFVGLYGVAVSVALGVAAAALVAVVELAVAATVLLEMFNVLSRESEYLALSHRLLAVSCVLSAGCAALTALAGPGLLFPFFASTPIGVAFCLILIAAKLLMIRQIVLVRDHRDKRYKLYLQALKFNRS